MSGAEAAAALKVVMGIRVLGLGLQPAVSSDPALRERIPVARKGKECVERCISNGKRGRCG